MRIAIPTLFVTTMILLGCEPAVETDEEDLAMSQLPPEEADLEGEACAQWGDALECSADGAEGLRFCDYFEGGMQWGACFTEYECIPGETRERGCSGPDDFECMACGTTEGCTLWGDGTPGWEACNTPLVLSFDRVEPAMEPAPAASFDISGTGECTTHDWPTAATPWLALDLDRSGDIESGRELFGSGTRLGSGRRAKNGFAALAELDADGDGRITAADPRFAQLVLWFDHDADKRASFAEVEPASAHGIVALELASHERARCDARGNCGIERASFTFADRDGVRTGEVVDVHLSCQ